MNIFNEKTNLPKCSLRYSDTIYGKKERISRKKLFFMVTLGFRIS